MSKVYVFGVVCFAVLACLGCSKKNGGASGPQIQMNIKNVKSSRGMDFNPMHTMMPGLFSDDTTRAVETVGQAAPTELWYYINNIQICQSLTANGSAFSGQSGCLSLLNPTQNPAYAYTPGVDYSNLATVAAADTTNFTNLMASSAPNLGTKTLDSSAVGSYNWGIITWYPVVKVNATVPMNPSSAATYHTHSGGTSANSGGGYSTTSPVPLATAPTGTDTGLAVVLHSNGGTYFKFQNPLNITADDISSSATYTLDLAFNSDGLIKGFQSSVAGTGGGVLSDSAGGNGNRVTVPFLSLTPIPHKTTDTVTREHYLFHQGTFDIRFDLYYITSDPTTIYGVEARTMYTSATSTGINDFPSPTYIAADTGASELKFLLWDNSTAVVQHFVRLSTPGTAPANVTIQCGGVSGGFTFGSCSSGTTTMSYELVSSGPLQ